MKLINFNNPSQYINFELNLPEKKWSEKSFKILLIFPDTYDVGMSHYGFCLIYNQLNKLENVIPALTEAMRVALPRKLPIIYPIETSNTAINKLGR